MNKYKLIVIICFFLFTFFLIKVNASINVNSLAGKIICLDSGHGGIDAGAQSKTIIEKNMNLIISKKLEKELIKRGAIIYQTRDGDYDLSKTTTNRKKSDLYNRAKYINEIKPDVYLSIHLNSTNSPVWRGLQIFYTKKNEQNKILAETITEYLKKNMNYVRNAKQDDTYYMYKNINYPGVLIEAGFISNPDDNYLLRQQSYQEKLVILIAESLEIYFQKNNNLISKNIYYSS